MDSEHSFLYKIMEEIKANATILKVLAHFDSRRGFSEWWDSIDEETQTEIIKELKEKLMNDD